MNFPLGVRNIIVAIYSAFIGFLGMVALIISALAKEVESNHDTPLNNIE